MLICILAGGIKIARNEFYDINNYIASSRNEW